MEPSSRVGESEFQFWSKSELEWERERIPELECKFEVRVSSRVSSGTDFQS